MTSLQSDTLLFGAAVVTERLLSFFLLPVLAKSISPVEYAIWAQSVVVVGVLSPLLLIGFQTALVKFFPMWASTPTVRDSVLLAMVVFIVALLSAISMLVISFDRNIARLIFGQSRFATYIPVLVGFLVSEVIYQFLVSILRATHRFRTISVYTVLKGGWRIGLFLLVLYCIKNDFYTAFVSFALIQLILVILMYAKDIPFARLVRTGIHSGRSRWCEVMSFSFPLVVLWIMTGLNNFTDRFFLTHIRGLEELASYSAAFSLVAASAIFYSVLGLTLFPVLAKLWAQDRREEAAVIVEQSIQVYLIFILPFIAGASIIGKDVLSVLTTESYIVPAHVFFLLACNVGLFGLYSIGIYLLMLEKNTLQFLGLMALAAIVNVILNAALVPYKGITGAALAGSVSNTILAIGTLYWSRKVLLWRFPLAAFSRIVLRCGVMAGFLLLASLWVDPTKPLVLMTILFLAGSLYLFLDFIDKQSSLLILLRRP
jgi:O-antigen/teichoic acid export membrane protein